MRYKIELCYDGTNFSGWQRQDNASSIQQVIEENMSRRIQEPIELVGCGRTDTGVHASHYVLHFDTDQALDIIELKNTLNKMLPEDIGILSVSIVAADFHARFDAVERNYIYHIHAFKDPFRKRYSYYFPPIMNADFDLIMEAGQVILDYTDFNTFCKSNTDVKTKTCHLTHSVWEADFKSGRFSYRIGADRFLRGMVRLIVGACLQVGLKKLTMEELKMALDQKVLLKRPLSVPPQGLFLSAVKYQK
jgi:tRNA pseudouridine38-40 synthase